MSAYYSKFYLNTACTTPYFHAHVPLDYPLDAVLRKSRAYRRLPPRLRELSDLSKQWAALHWDVPADANVMSGWYDADNYELDPSDGHRLTDAEIDAQWPDSDLELMTFIVHDIPIPAGGFADPDMWEPATVGTTDLVDRSGMTKNNLLNDIASRGRKATAEEYGVPVNWLTSVRSDDDLASMILDMHGKPWPVSGQLLEHQA